MNDERITITITIDTPEMPNNDTIAIQTLLEIVGHLHRHGIYPTLLRVEIAPTPTTT